MSLVEQLRALLAALYGEVIHLDWLVTLLVTVTMIIFWVLLAVIVLNLVKIILLHTKKVERKLGKKAVSKEQYTVRRLFNNIIQFFFLMWIAIMILGELGLDVVPVLAGAGVLAFAIGFGAQELIKDVIAGVFLIIERTFRIGDYVVIGENAGTIKDVGLRRIVLENWKGETITINNGDIRTIRNASLLASVAVVEFRADYDFDLQAFESRDFKAFLSAFKEAHSDVLEVPGPIMVVNLNDGVLFTVHIKTKTRKQVGVERAFRKALLTYVQEHNLDIFVPVMIKAINDGENEKV